MSISDFRTSQPTRSFTNILSVRRDPIGRKRESLLLSRYKREWKRHRCKAKTSWALLSLSRRSYPYRLSREDPPHVGLSVLPRVEDVKLQKHNKRNSESSVGCNTKREYQTGPKNKTKEKNYPFRKDLVITRVQLSILSLLKSFHKHTTGSPS